MPWVDADTVLTILSQPYRHHLPVQPEHLHFQAAAELATRLGWKYEHQSDGTTLILVEGPQ